MIPAALLRTIAPYAVGLLLAGGAYWWAYNNGWDAREQLAIEQAQEKQAEIDELTIKNNEAAKDLADLYDAQDRLAREVEDEVRANPDDCRRITPDSLQRLRRRWGD